jgi:MerR family transcriptional regulator, copper efflux regulator
MNERHLRQPSSQPIALARGSGQPHDQNLLKAKGMTIGEVAQRSGVTAKMIRHYEALGLLPAAVRSAAGYRYYDETALHEVRFIRQARHLGFGLPQIADLLALWRDRGRASHEVKALAEAQLHLLEQKIAELQQMQESLQRLVSQCHGDDRPECPILDELATEKTALAPKKGCHDDAG